MWPSVALWTKWLISRLSSMFTERNCHIPLQARLKVRDTGEVYFPNYKPFKKKVKQILVQAVSRRRFGKSPEMSIELK